MFFLSLICVSCRYTPDLSGGGGGTDNIGSPSDGKIVSDCNQNSAYNACIYRKNPVAQKEGPVNSNNLRSDLTSLQTYAVNIQDTVDGLLKNTHYNVTVENVTLTQGAVNSIVNHAGHIIADMIIYGLSPTLKVTRAKLSDGKWTAPYEDDENFLVEQAMTYYWLTYQQNWMKDNTSQFYASNKNIQAVAVSDVALNAYWSPLENKIVLGLGCILNSSGTVCQSDIIGMALNAEILIHEAGHANFSHSAPSPTARGTENAGCQTHRNCKDKSQSICDLSQEEISQAGTCCDTEKGCSLAIDEGQADFHASILFSNNPSIGDLLANNTRGITGCFPGDGPSRNPVLNKNATSSQIFDSCQAGFGGKGEIHVMGILYNSIWWEVYSHTETQQEDILKLFTEHLPLLHYDDNFETVGGKIINLTKQVFEGSKGSSYADIIEDEFSRRGLNLSL